MYFRSKGNLTPSPFYKRRIFLTTYYLFIYHLVFIYYSYSNNCSKNLRIEIGIRQLFLKFHFVWHLICQNTSHLRAVKKDLFPTESIQNDTMNVITLFIYF